MTAKELFEKHGPGVWWSYDKRDQEKDFRPLGLNEKGTHIIGENENGCADQVLTTDDACHLYQPPKQKVVRWKWAYKYNGSWVETSGFYSNDEIKVVEVTPLKLEYTRTEFTE
jgi:hypothetical protein